MIVAGINYPCEWVQLITGIGTYTCRMEKDKMTSGILPLKGNGTR